jgi:hypothetical protein
MFKFFFWVFLFAPYIYYFSKQLLSGSCIVIFVCLSSFSHVPWLFINGLYHLIDTQATQLYELAKYFNSTLNLRIYIRLFFFSYFLSYVFKNIRILDSFDSIHCFYMFIKNHKFLIFLYLLLIKGSSTLAHMQVLWWCGTSKTIACNFLN